MASAFTRAKDAALTWLRAACTPDPETQTELRDITGIFEGTVGSPTESPSIQEEVQYRNLRNGVSSFSVMVDDMSKKTNLAVELYVAEKFPPGEPSFAVDQCCTSSYAIFRTFPYARRRVVNQRQKRVNFVEKKLMAREMEHYNSTNAAHSESSATPAPEAWGPIVFPDEMDNPLINLLEEELAVLDAEILRSVELDKLPSVTQARQKSTYEVARYIHGISPDKLDYMRSLHDHVAGKKFPESKLENFFVNTPWLARLFIQGGELKYINITLIRVFTRIISALWASIILTGGPGVLYLVPMPDFAAFIVFVFFIAMCMFYALMVCNWDFHVTFVVGAAFGALTIQALSIHRNMG